MLSVIIFKKISSLNMAKTIFKAIKKILIYKMNDLSENSYLNLEQILNPLNEDDDLEEYNSNQDFNIYDPIFPMQYGYPGLDFEFEFEDFITEERRLTNESIINTRNEHEYDIFDKKVTFNTTNGLRGRKRKNYNYKNQRKVHGKLDKDNILRKVNVVFFSFIIDLANKIVDVFKFKEKFFPLAYAFKQNISKKRLNYLKGLTLGEILCSDISGKFKKLPSNKNKIFYQQVINNENIRKFFSKNFMSVFNIFIKNQRNIKIGNIELNISPKVKMFDDFLLDMKKIYAKDSDLYIEKIKEIIKNY